MAYSETERKNSIDTLLNVLHSIYKNERKVSFYDNELTINLIDPKQVQNLNIKIEVHKSIVDFSNPFRIVHYDFIVEEKKKELEELLPEFKYLFKSAGVERYTFEIEGKHIVTFDYSTLSVIDIARKSKNENAMTELVKIVQLSYNLQNVKAKVSCNGSELIINIIQENIVEAYNQVLDFLKNPKYYSEEDIKLSNKFITDFKQAGKGRIDQQSNQDRILYKAAGVKIYTMQIDGNFINSTAYL